MIYNLVLLCVLKACLGVALYSGYADFCSKCNLQDISRSDEAAAAAASILHSGNHGT